jgi:hypothetical protein
VPWGGGREGGRDIMLVLHLGYSPGGTEETLDTTQ